MRVGILVASAIAITAIGATAAPAPATSLAERQAQAGVLEAQISKLEERYDGLQERTRGVRIELAGLQIDTRAAQVHLASIRTRLDAAQLQLGLRAVAMYQGKSSSLFADIAASGSMSNLFERMEATQRISMQDVAIFEHVRDLKLQVAAQETTLRHSRDTTRQLARKLEKDSRTMAAVVSKRREALSSAKAEVRALMEQQRRAAAARIEVASQSRVASLARGETPDASPAEDTQPDAPASPIAMTIPLPPSSGVAAAAASIAMGKIGAPYVWAAAGPNSFDCSGLVVWAFAQAGRPGLPHSTYSLIAMGIDVPLSQAQPGDLIFTNNTGHMGIYVGGGSFVHSPRTGRTVSVEPLTNYNVVAVQRI